MKSRSRIALFVCFVSLLTSAAFAQETLSVGANVNMVSGESFPNGDPFQRQQNEPSVAFSSRNSLHLLAGANDYRAVDVPGLPSGLETGDSWLSYFWSTNGGATWKSTLMPGYPQDPACQGPNPPTLCGYAAGADPVVRAGVNGMFYYSGIVFERGDPSRSAIFVSRFIDLNNDEGGDPIRYIDTIIIDANNNGAVFLDKSWIGVDIPRGSITDTFSVAQRDGSTVNQTVACGNVYVGYAAISGEDENLRSEIRMATSTDCGNSWDIQPVSQPDSLNQGANIGIHPLTGELHVVWRRFDTVETFLGVSPTGCPARSPGWLANNDWPVDSIEMGGVTYTEEQARELIGRKHRGDETIKVARRVIAAKLNLLTGGGDPVNGFDAWQWSQDLNSLIDEADAWFLENPVGSKPKKKAKKEGLELRKAIQRITLGSGVCSETGGEATTTTTGETNAIMAVSSLDFGETFSEPVVIDESSTFDQGSTRFSFRTTAYPSVTVDADGRIYVAWAARGYATIRGEPSDGDARIVLSTSTNGLGWSSPYAVDEPGREGHQIKPSILFAGGQLMLVFYDFRQDVSNIFEAFVLDLPEADRLRHTVDVRVATAVPDAVPVFTDYSLISDGTATGTKPTKPSDSASRYIFVTSQPGLGAGSVGETLQLEYMVPNFPMFADGTTPFIGDYVDIAAPNLINDGGIWRFASNAGDVQVWQAVWADNRNVVPPPDGDWSKYVAPILDAQPSVFDPTVTIPSCNDVFFTDSDFPEGSLYTGTRNQNVYSASISNGVIVAAPGNNRPLGGFDPTGAPLQRGFVVFIQNTTAQPRDFRVSLPGTPSGVEASFAPGEVVTTRDIEIPPYSSAVVTVYAALDGSPASEAIPVSVEEIGGTLSGSVLLNSDPAAPDPLVASLLTTEVHNPAVLNPAVLNPAVLNASVGGAEFLACTADPAKCVLNPAVLNPAVLNPAVLNPAVLNPAALNPAVLNPAVLNPAVFNPAVLNPAVLNPAVMNPAVLNPAVLNPAVFNPAVFNPAVLNPAVLNPAVMNPAVLNPAVLNPAVLNPAVLNPAVLNPAVLNPAVLNSAPAGQVEVTFAIRNDGNATTAYDLNLAVPGIEGLDYDLVVYRLNETPVAEGCMLGTEAQQQLIFSQTVPLNETVDGSFYLEPGQEVLVTFTVRPDVEADTPVDPTTTFESEDLFGQVSSQPPNTDPTMTPPASEQFGPPTSCDIAGDWSGTYFQPGFSPYPMVVTNLVCDEPGNVIANVVYPTLGGCSGTWTLDAIVDGRYQVTENVSGGFCVPVVEHEFLALDRNTISGFTPDFDSTFSLFRTGFTETVITSDLDILNDGLLIAANDLGASPSAVTVNGVTFGTNQGGLTGPWGPGGGDFSLDPFSTNLDALLSDLQFSGTLNPVSLTIGGLTPGTDYRLQLLFSNDLNTTGDRVEVTVEGRTWILDDWQPDAINLIANFTASSSSVTVTFAPGVGSTGESGRAVLNAYALHEAAGPGMLVSADDPVFGVGSITLDTATGLEWLDLAFSVNRSFDDVSANFGPGGDFEGFRYATAAELITLYTNAGIVNVDTNVFEAVNYVPVRNLLDLTGETWLGTGSGPFAGGFVSDIHPLGGRRVSFYQVNNAGTEGRANVITSGREQEGNAITVAGSHLVRATGVTISSISPTTGAPGDGFLVISGANLPDPSFPTAAVVSDGVTTLDGFIFQSPSSTSRYFVRLPAGFPIGPATIQIQNGATSSNAYPFTVSATPGTPIITGVFSSPGQLPTTTATPGGKISVAANGIDTTGWELVFTQGASSWSVTPDASNFALSNSVIGLTLDVVVPAGLASGSVDVTVRQGASAFSAPVTLTVP